MTEDQKRRLAEAFHVKYGVEVETYFDLIGSMCYVTARKDHADLTEEQITWIDGFSAALSSEAGHE